MFSFARQVNLLYFIFVGLFWFCLWVYMYMCIFSHGEGNGNPLQYPCLENPRDREPGGLPYMGSHRVGHNWSDFAAAAAAYSVTVFIVAINLCIYIGLLQFCGVFLFFPLFFLLPFFSSFLYFKCFKPYFIFSTFISLFAFPTVLFPLQLIFDVYKSSSSTSI